jgi:hypothetical protein
MRWIVMSQQHSGTLSDALWCFNDMTIHAPACTTILNDKPLLQRLRELLVPKTPPDIVNSQRTTALQCVILLIYALMIVDPSAIDDVTERPNWRVEVLVPLLDLIQELIDFSAKEMPNALITPMPDLLSRLLTLCKETTGAVQTRSLEVCCL